MYVDYSTSNITNKNKYGFIIDEYYLGNSKVFVYINTSRSNITIRRDCNINQFIKDLSKQLIEMESLRFKGENNTLILSDLASVSHHEREYDMRRSLDVKFFLYSLLENDINIDKCLFHFNNLNITNLPVNIEDNNLDISL